LTAQAYAEQLRVTNLNQDVGSENTSTILISDDYAGTTHPMTILKGVLVMDRVLDLNSNMPLTLQGFHAGREIVFPTEEDLTERHHIIDVDTARTFYEISSFYLAFEDAFKRQASEIAELLGGCPGWESGSYGRKPPTQRRGEVMPDPSGVGRDPAHSKDDPAEIKRAQRKLAEAEALKALARRRLKELGVSGAVMNAELLTVNPAGAVVNAQPASATKPEPVPATPAAIKQEPTAWSQSLRDNLKLAMELVADATGPQQIQRKQLHDSAVRAFKSGQEAEGYLALGRIFLDANLSYTAVELFEAASQTANTKEVHRALAEAYARMGKTKESKKHREQARLIQVQPAVYASRD
jgi:hypothetical protein